MTSLLPRLRAHHVLMTSVVLGIAAGCAAGTSLDAQGNVPTADAGSNHIRTVGGSVDSGTKEMDDGSNVELLNPLCGTTNLCDRHVPDDTQPCVEGDGGPSFGVPGRDASIGRKDAGTSDASMDGGPDASGIRPEAGRGIRDAGLDGGDADADTRLESPPIPALPPLPDAGPRFSCQVSTDSLGKPVHECLPAGMGGEKEPCSAPKDCAPGFACVGASPTNAGDPLPKMGLCLRYCCRVGPMCDPGKYCTERPLLEATTKSPLIVPVCADGISCDVLEPFPCTAQVCACPHDMACTIVRNDGTTGCLTPGKGTVGQACPCAPGYYCSLATETCVKVCKTDGIDKRCNPGKCQLTAGFPPGLGICVGSTPTKQ
jgi:hypothetical protein